MLDAQPLACNAHGQQCKLIDGDHLFRSNIDRPGEIGIDKTANAFALKARTGLMASAPVFDEAEKALKFVVDLAMGPKRREAEVRAMMDASEANVIDAFARACRAELRALA